MTRIMNIFVATMLAVLLAWTAQAEEVFKDDFEGEVLGEDWDVINPDTESYIVEGGALLIVYAQESSIDSDELQNLFRLTTALPKGDWQATIRLQPEFQTMREVMYFGLFQDRQNYMMANAYVASWCCHARNLSISGTKNAKGKKAHFAAALTPEINHGAGAFDAYRDTFRKLGDGILLRLAKTGRQYVFSGRIEGSDANGKPLPWIPLQKLTSLRQKGDLVFGFTQGASGGGHVGGGGESIVNVDWVQIETLE